MARAAKTAKVTDSKPASSGATIHPLSRVTDTLTNLVTGMGTGKDKSTATQFIWTPMMRDQQEAAYRGDWVSRKVIDIPAFDATREWRTWQADTKDLNDLTDAEEKFGLQRKFMGVLKRSRLYGGAALVLGVDQGKPEEPLDFDKLGKDCLKFVHLVSRYELTAGEIEWDITNPNFGQPSYYERVTLGGTMRPVRLDPSRVIRFVGAEIPDVQQSQGWGDSVLQIVQDAVLSLGTVHQSITALISEAKTDIVSIPELSERISDKAYEDKLKTRFAMAQVMKSIYNVLLIDKEEQWQRIEQAFTGMPEILQEFMLIVCGAADIPATRFLGQAPKGMNATGDSDTRNYYDRISTEQRIEIGPLVEPLDRLLQINAFGKEPDGMYYEWNPLWQMSDTEKSVIAKAHADIMTQDVAAALLDPMVLQKARENQLIEDGTYPGIEQIIEDYGTDIDERTPDPTADVPTHIDPNTGLPANPATDPTAVPNPAHPLNQQGAGTGGAAGGSNVVPIGKAKGAVAAPKKGQPVGKKTAAADEAIESMATRIRDAQLIDGSTPRTLYIHRPVLNWRDIAKHYKAQGIDNVYGADMHVTVCYSKTPVDWLKVGEDSWGNDENGNLTVKPGGPRVNEQFGKYFVLAFANSDLAWRHCSILDRTDGSWEYDDYTPHVSISKDPGAVDPMKIEAWTGPINLGPEVFEEIKVEGAMYDGTPAPTITDAAPTPQPPITINLDVTLPKGGKVKKTIEYGADGRPATITETPEE
jgi:phage-related protein (TIGR01555 family)